VRALQPPFSACIATVAGGDKPCATRSLGFQRGVFKAVLLVAVANGVEGIVFFFNPHMKAVSIAMVGTAILLIAACFFSLRNLKIATRKIGDSS
jgi:hypothetical protein